MKKLYLSSEIDKVAHHIANDIGNPSKKRLAFIYTAYEFVKEEPEWLIKNRLGLINAGFDVFDYTITDKNIDNFEQDLGDVDIIHVNGGDSFYLLLQSKKTGFDKWIKKVVENGKIYTSSSAGSSAAAPNIEIKAKKISTEFQKQLDNFDGYNLVDFMIMPHWGREDFRRLYQNERFELSYKPENKIILLNDFQYVKVEGDSYRIVDVRD